jgi:lipopolysaccharide heptosyltransferase II
MNEQFKTAKNILIVRLGSMGDIVQVIPAAINLREAFPSVHISWLVEDKLQDLVEGLPCINSILVFPRRQWQSYLKNPLKYAKLFSEIKLFLKELRKRNYDIALDFHGNFRSGLLTYLSNAKARLGFSRGYCKEGNFIFTNVRIAPHGRKIHRIDKYLSLLRGLEIEAHYRKPVFSIPAVDRLYIDNFILHNHLDKKPLAIIHPGTSQFGQFKRWHTKYYAQLADRLIHELNYSAVFTWGPAEYTIVEEILSYMQQQAIPACKTSSVKQLIALIHHARLFIGSDTGPTHIASCLGIPTVAIFGPKDPAIYAPYDKNASVVRKDLPCSPCEKRTCRHVVCIDSISPDDVFDAVCKLNEKKFDFLNTA